ncbi:hypothetical protein, partial [Pseudomonas lundensis]
GQEKILLLMRTFFRGDYRTTGFDAAVILFEYEVSSLAFEFSGKDTTLLGHLTPRYGEHSRLNECPVSLDHYT